jgi:hypothetical protein
MWCCANSGLHRFDGLPYDNVSLSNRRVYFYDPPNLLGGEYSEAADFLATFLLGVGAVCGHDSGSAVVGGGGLSFWRGSGLPRETLGPERDTAHGMRLEGKPVFWDPKHCLALRKQILGLQRSGEAENPTNVVTGEWQL